MTLIHQPASFAGRIGVARRDITPPVGIYNRFWGAAKHDTAEGIHRPLCLTALAIAPKTGDEPLVLAAVDGCCFMDASTGSMVLDAVLGELRIAPARFMFNFSHTHAGGQISLADADKPGGHLIEPYVRDLQEAIIGAARDAINFARPATLTWATGRCGLASNRDLPDPEGNRYVVGFNPDAPADDTLLVGRVTDDEDDLVIATVVNYACHPTTLAWDNRLISPDFVGAMREVVEATTGGAPCVFLQGASGELAPRHQYVGDVAVADGHGRYLGGAAVAALASMLPPGQRLAYRGAVESGAALGLWQPEIYEPPTAVGFKMIDVPLPLKPMPEARQIEAELAACTDRVTGERLKRKLAVAQKVGPGPACPTHAWAWRAGDTLFLGHPNEAYSVLQVELRRQFPGQAVVVMNLVNGAIGYLSPAEFYKHDIYPVWQSPFAESALRVLIDRSAAGLRELSK